MANQSINLNFIPSGIAEVVNVAQCDEGREITFNIYQGTSSYTIPNDTTIEVHGEKADRKVFVYTENDLLSDGTHIVSHSGSTITLRTSKQMTAASGEANVQFRLIKGTMEPDYEDPFPLDNGYMCYYTTDSSFIMNLEYGRTGYFYTNTEPNFSGHCFIIQKNGGQVYEVRGVEQESATSWKVDTKSYGNSKQSSSYYDARAKAIADQTPEQFVGTNIGTLNFTLRVETDPAAEGDISESELPSIIAQATEQMEAAERAATAAGHNADAARDVEETCIAARNRAESAATRAETAAETAEAADLNPPYIGTNGNWYTFDTTTGQYRDTGVAATGNPGATGNGISDIEKTGSSGLVDSYRINYTNGGHFDYTVTNGKDGAGGVSSVNNVAPVQGNVTLTKSNIGLGNVDNTADANKSVASATKATQDQSGNNIKSSYAASMTYANNVLSLLNKDRTALSTVTIQGGGGGGIAIDTIISHGETQTDEYYRYFYNFSINDYLFYIFCVVQTAACPVVFPTAFANAGYSVKGFGEEGREYSISLYEQNTAVYIDIRFNNSNGFTVYVYGIRNA